MTEPETIGEAQHELAHAVQSPATLLRACAFSVVLAAAVLIGTILPAEYGIDPTGIGAAIGLTPLATSKSIEESDDLGKTSQENGYREDSVNIRVPAGTGLEYKFHLLNGDALRYDWSSSDGELLFDFHGEPDGDTTGYFESYTVSTAGNARGTFTASFDGAHGWYWENKSQSPIVVLLKTEGTYEIIGTK